MLTRLRLERFKNFADAELSLGPLTTLVGTNASGKSNLRDALRLLHGIARGYTLADILGEKWGEGGVLQWRGIRGGALEAVYLGAATFTLTASFEVMSAGNQGELLPSPAQGIYQIEVEPGRNGRSRVVRESLYGGSTMMFDSHPAKDPPQQSDPQHLTVRIQPGGQYRKARVEKFIAHQPALSQVLERIAERKDERAGEVRHWVRSALATFGSMRFLDLSTEAMRLPSLPGQTILGDRGENLSSVLQAIYEDEQRRRTLIEWIRELTPMDVVDFIFPADQTGRVLVSLVEAGHQKTSAYSASDGTLRFLTILAALLGPEPARLYFFEELENGLHPARLHLLLDLIEKRVARRDIQVVATTHSPQLLRLLSAESRQYASLCYRLSGRTEANIRRVLDLPPEAHQVLDQKDLGSLFASGWFENIMSFMQDEEA
jgi:predicted ATPase